MIRAEAMLDYGSHRIDRITYYDCPSDCANCANLGKDRVTYEVIDSIVNDLIEAFDTFEEAQEYAENQIMWQWSMADCLPSEVQNEHRKAVRSLLIWFISNTRWIAAHEGEQGIERFVKEVKAELKSA